MQNPENIKASLSAKTPVSTTSTSDTVTSTPEEIALLEAAGAGRLEEVRARIAQGVKIDCLDKNGNTSLMRAAIFDRRDVLQFLLHKGASLCIENKERRRVLQIAAEDGDNPDTIEILMKALRANPKAWAFYSENREWFAALYGASDKSNNKSLKVLIRHLDACVNDFKGTDQALEESYLLDRDHDERTLLMTAAESGHNVKKTQECIGILLEAGVSFKSRDNRNRDVLYYAAVFGFDTVLTFLIETIIKDHDYFKQYCIQGLFAGLVFDTIADGDEDSAQNLQILMSYAALHDSHTPNYKLVDSCETSGGTFLHYAASVGNCGAVKRLIDQGVRLDRKNKQNQTALDVARAIVIPDDHPIKAARTIAKKQNMIAVLESAEKLTALCKGTLAIAPGELPPTVVSLLEQGASLHQRTSAQIPLAVAIMGGQLSVVEELLNCAKKSVFRKPERDEVMKLVSIYAYDSLNDKMCKIILRCIQFHVFKEQDTPKSQVAKICVYLERKEMSFFKPYGTYMLGCDLKDETLRASERPKEAQAIARLSFDVFNKIPHPSGHHDELQFGKHYKAAQLEIAEMLFLGILVLDADGEIESCDFDSLIKDGERKIEEEIKEAADQLTSTTQKRMEKALFYAMKAGDHPQALQLRAQLSNIVGGAPFQVASAFGDLCDPGAVVQLLVRYQKLQEKYNALERATQSIQDAPSIAPQVTLDKAPESGSAVAVSINAQAEPAAITGQYQASKKRGRGDNDEHQGAVKQPAL